LLGAPERLLGCIDEPVARAMQALAERERSALLLRALGGLAYAEIAAALAVPLGTVMTALHRARAKLRRALADYARDRGLARPALGSAARGEASP
jgi:RNA polymerase sigma-70 factor (ECF subfamily)